MHDLQHAQGLLFCPSRRACLHTSWLHAQLLPPHPPRSHARPHSALASLTPRPQPGQPAAAALQPSRLPAPAAAQVEIKPEMVAHYLAEFSITYKPVKHGRPGIGASTTSRFIPLK